MVRAAAQPPTRLYGCTRRARVAIVLPIRVCRVAETPDSRSASLSPFSPFHRLLFPLFSVLARRLARAQHNTKDNTLAEQTAIGMPIVQFAPFQSLVQPAFWHALTDLKIDVLRLSDDALPLAASYAPGRAVKDRETGQEIALGCNLAVSGDAFGKEPQ